MRIDIHTHIFPPWIVEERNRFFPGDPWFKLLYDSPRADLSRARSLIDAMDRSQIDRAVVFGFPWEDVELAVRHNDYVLECAARYAPRLIPFGCVNPLSAGMVEEADRCLRSGARGLGEMAIYGTCDAAFALGRFEELIRCCASYNGIMLVHANEPVGHSYAGKAPMGLDFYYSLARLSRGTPLILAHWGGGLCFYELLKREAGDILAQVYYDTAASPYLYHPRIYELMIRLLPKKKILFGSDYPLLSPDRYFSELFEAGLSDDERDSILGGNAADLLGLNE